MRLAGKVAVITGAARGIGEEIALSFAKEGADLILLDMKEELLLEVKKKVEALGRKAFIKKLNVTDEEACKEAAKEALQVFPQIHILVNNAGIYVKHPEDIIDSEKPASFLNTTTAHMRSLFEVNVYGTMYVTRAFLPQMVAQNYGKIINMGSITGVNGKANSAEYSATKGAIISFTKALAVEVAQYHINVNVISPGSILVEGITAPATFIDRPGCPSDIARAAVYFASSDSDFIVGQNITIDGGRTLSLKCD